MTNNSLWQAKYAKNIGVLCLISSSFDNNNIEMQQHNLSHVKSSIVHSFFNWLATGWQFVILMAKMEELHKSAVRWLVSLPRLNDVSFQHNTVMQTCATGT